MPEASRKIEFEGIVNARDLGGLVNTDGKMLRRGCLIRSANLSKATPADVKKLMEDCRLTLVIDLRTPMAARQKPDVEAEGVRHLQIPVFTDAMIGVSHENDRDYEHRKKMMPPLKDLYRMMIRRPECREKFGLILRMIMTHDFDQGSVLWHCSEGKDRCGLITAFLLTILRVDRQTIIRDYMLTNEVNVERAEYYYREVLKNGGDEPVAASVRDAFLTREDYIESAFEEIASGWGSMENFFREALNIGEDLQEAFRAEIIMHG